MKKRVWFISAGESPVFPALFFFKRILFPIFLPSTSVKGGLPSSVSVLLGLFHADAMLLFLHSFSRTESSGIPSVCSRLF